MSAMTPKRMGASRPSPFPPAPRDLDAQAEVIEHPLHDEVHQLADLCRTMVEAGRGRDTVGAGFGHRDQISQMDQR